MAGAAGEGVASDPLAVWYLEGEPIFYALSDCCDIVQDIQSGTAPNPVAQLIDLSAIVQGVEIWLLTHPAPEAQHAEYVGSIVNVFVALGELYEGFSDDVAQADDGTLDLKIAQAVTMVDEVKRIRDDRIRQALRS